MPPQEEPIKPQPTGIGTFQLPGSGSVSTVSHSACVISYIVLSRSTMKNCGWAEMPKVASQECDIAYLISMEIECKDMTSIV